MELKTREQDERRKKIVTFKVTEKEIEELKARNTYLENKNKIFTSWNNMSDRERLILVLLWVVVIILIAFIITLSVTNTTKNPIETKEDYERLQEEFEKEREENAVSK